MIQNFLIIFSDQEKISNDNWNQIVGRNFLSSFFTFYGYLLRKSFSFRSIYLQGSGLNVPSKIPLFENLYFANCLTWKIGFKRKWKEWKLLCQIRNRSIVKCLNAYKLLHSFLKKGNLLESMRCKFFSSFSVRFKNCNWPFGSPYSLICFINAKFWQI